MMLTPDSAQHFEFAGNYYSFWKYGQGKPLVFLHNAGTSSLIWSHQIAAFSKDFTCYVLDLPGYGESRAPGKKLPLQFYSLYLTRFLTEQSLSSVTLIGNCLGSAISLHYASLGSKKLDRLILFHVLSETTVKDGILRPLFWSTGQSKMLRHTLRSVLSGFNLPGPLRKFAVKTQFAHPARMDSALLQKLNALLEGPGTFGALADILADLESYRNLDRFLVSDQFPRSLILWGTKNQVLPLKAGSQFCERAGFGNFRAVQEAGHLAMLERPDEVNKMMKEFLEETPRAR